MELLAAGSTAADSLLTVILTALVTIAVAAVGAAIKFRADRAGEVAKQRDSFRATTQREAYAEFASAAIQQIDLISRIRRGRDAEPPAEDEDAKAGLTVGHGVIRERFEHLRLLTDEPDVVRTANVIKRFAYNERQVVQEAERTTRAPFPGRAVSKSLGLLLDPYYEACRRALHLDQLDLDDLDDDEHVKCAECGARAPRRLRTEIDAGRRCRSCGSTEGDPKPAVADTD